MAGQWASFWNRPQLQDLRRSLPSTLRQVAKALAAAALTWCAAEALHLPQVHWAVISTLVVVQGTPGATVRAGRDRVLATAFGALVGTLASLAQGWGWPAPVLLMAALAPAVLLASLRRDFRTAPIAAMIVISSISSHASPVHAALLRVAEISLGAIIGIAVSRWFLPMPTQARMRLDAMHLLEQLCGYAAGIGRDPAVGPALGEEQAEERTARIRSYLREAAVIARDARHEGKLVHEHAQELATNLRRLYEDLALIKRVAAQARRRSAGLHTLLEQLGPGLQDSLHQELLQLQQGRTGAARASLEQLSAALAAAPEQTAGDLQAVLRYALGSLQRQLDGVAQLLAPGPAGK
ncbi:FUSC family protein [Undibacterium sp.]|jgi:uncharacterized membrane protein YgaE (UPF0421/DUF939 family)|uniref:FUSC family protein n=1 Tax=Undibacterium sp. TaxID=1914977 RepID=UPI002BECA8C4|nr:FUSC family protein [Undibacterium sp.]HTD04047.1 FUSC family protein [Undibacterium sp.]